MLTIREAQMAALERAGMRAFARQLCGVLRQSYAELVGSLDDVTLLDRVARGVERAHALGMRIESSYLAFVVLMFHVGPRFDEHPAVRQALNDSALPPDNRLEHLSARVSAAEFADAGRLGSWDPAGN
jgi:hypothetical protein